MRLLGCCLLAITAWGQTAGRITHVNRIAVILRGVQNREARPQTDVEWNDRIKTSSQGHVRVILDDGSILNVGENSSLRIVHHNPETQSTLLHLEYGFLRAEVARIARPSSAFEVHTPTTVGGVLGTHFEMETCDQATQIHVHDGFVQFTHKLSGKRIRLRHGLHAHIVRGEGRFHVHLNPEWSEQTLRRWSSLDVERAEEARERDQERQRKRQKSLQ